MEQSHANWCVEENNGRYTIKFYDEITDDFETVFEVESVEQLYDLYNIIDNVLCDYELEQEQPSN